MESGGGKDDAQLVEAFLHGDEGAFAELVRRHQRGLYEFVWRQVRSHAEAADLSQRALVQAFLKIRHFRGEAQFKTWLYQIAINLCKNHYRSKDRERLAPVALESMALVADDPGPDLVLEQKQQTGLARAIEALPPKQRLTLRLRFFQDCTFPEIAQMMKCPIGTAKANYHHGITALRKYMRGTAHD